MTQHDQKNQDLETPEKPARYTDDPVQETKSKLLFAAIAFGGMIIAKILGF